MIQLLALVDLGPEERGEGDNINRTHIIHNTNAIAICVRVRCLKKAIAITTVRNITRKARESGEELRGTHPKDITKETQSDDVWDFSSPRRIQGVCSL